MGEFDRFELCLKELELVQGHIARYDANGLTIKSWALATASALAAYAVVHRSAFVAVIGALVTVAFASAELVYRCFQSRFIARAATLESVLQSEDLGRYRYALTSAAVTPRWRDEVRSSIRQPHFTLLYALVIFLSLILALALRLDWLPVLPKPW